jgi:hypothetical protein
MAGPTLYRPGDITSGLQGYWKLSEASGSRADSGPNGNTLTDNNTVTNVAYDYWRTGENSAYFNSANSEYLSRTNANQVGLGFTSSFTFALWVRPGTQNTLSFINKTNSGNNDGYRCQLNQLGQIELWINGSQHTTSTYLFYPDSWYHFAFVFNNSTDVVSIYINGNCVHASVETGTPNANTNEFRLGYYEGMSTYLGVMKDVGAWNRALTPLEIKSLAMGVDLLNKAVRPDSVGATSYWKMNTVATNNGANEPPTNGSVTLIDAYGGPPSGGGFIEGSSRNFDGFNHYFYSADSAEFDLSGGVWSVGFWIKLNTLKNYNCIWNQRTDDNNFIQFFCDSSGGLTFQIQVAGSAVVATSTGNIISAGAWYYIAITENGNTYKIYVDGEDKTTSGGTDTDRPANYTGNFRIGVGPVAALANYMRGTICDFAIWKGSELDLGTIKNLSSAFPIQQTGIVSYWKLDESGTPGTLADAIGANPLTTSGSPSMVAGKVNNGIDLENGSSQYATITDGAQTGLDQTVQWTLMAWIKLESTGIHNYIAVKQNSAISQGYALAINTSNNIHAYNADGAGSNNATALSSGTWYHVCAAYTGSRFYLYLNGWFESNNAYATLPNDTAGNFYLGCRADPGYYFDGIIDELVACGRHLREEEVKSVYIKGKLALAITYDPIGLNMRSAFFPFLA